MLRNGGNHRFGDHGQRKETEKIDSGVSGPEKTAGERAGKERQCQAAYHFEDDTELRRQYVCIVKSNMIQYHKEAGHKLFHVGNSGY